MGADRWLFARNCGPGCRLLNASARISGQRRYHINCHIFLSILDGVRCLLVYRSFLGGLPARQIYHVLLGPAAFDHYWIPNIYECGKVFWYGYMIAGRCMKGIGHRHLQFVG